MSKAAADMTAGVVQPGTIAMDREADLAFAEAAFPASLKTVESFLLSSPANERLLLVLARGYNAYAFAFVERALDKARIVGTSQEVEDLTRRGILHYLRGRDYGLRLLDDALVAAARGGDLAALDGALARVRASDAPALFWATYGWAGAANLGQSDPELVGALPVVERMMERVVALDPGYDAGSPLLFQGVYFAAKPTMAGGDPSKARSYFDRARKEHPDNLLAPYLWGRFGCAQLQDRGCLDAAFAEVLAADPSHHPDRRLLAEVARDLARFWVAHAEDLVAA
jgi:hypothetical protein